MRNPNTASREEQRRLILTSAAYLAGDSFTRIEAAKLIGLSLESGANLLTGMANDGLLTKRLVQGRQGSKAVGTVHYSRPPSKLARVAWRRVSNEAIGIRV